MANIIFEPVHKIMEVPVGTTILEAARRAGVLVESPCNGTGVCGKCKVRLDPASSNNVVKHNRHHLSEEEEKQGYFLSCETEVHGDITVELVDGKDRNDTLKVLSHGQSIVIDLDSHITKEFFAGENLTRIYAGQEVIATEDGDTADKNYGLVVDIGTTTLVTSLVDLNTGEELESVSSLNPQSVHAQDVLSRINFASEDDGLSIMYSAIINEINGMIGELTAKTGVEKDNIYEAVFSGNTCMLHLATNVNPEPMGQYPYKPEVTGGNCIKASDHSLAISPYGLIYLPPVVSAYVGADITSGILAANLAGRKKITLFVDIGTNGEMVFGSEGRLLATSTAAGPAFEGMNITFGMRAGNGAVELFEVHDDGEVEIKTIGNTKPVGICGSGLLDIVGELVAHGVINKSGRLVSPGTEGLPLALRERLVKYKEKPAFQVADEVYLTQKDIRQVQLAKGAIRAGIEFLLQNRGVKAYEVDSVLIAGSFGYHLRAKSLINLGLLPAEFAGRIEFIGNTSKSGGQAFLLNNGHRQRMQETVKQIDVLDLAGFKDFDKVFVDCLNF